MGCDYVKDIDCSKLFFNLPIGIIYYNCEGEMLASNPAALEILGCSKNEIKDNSTFGSTEKVLADDGSDFPESEHPSKLALQKGEMVKDRVMGIFHPVKQEYRWINVNAVPEFKDGETQPFQIFVTVEDITADILTRKNLKKSEEKYRTLVDNMYSGLVIIQNGIITFANKTLSEKSGYEIDEMVDHNFLQFIAAEERERLADFYTKRLAGEPVPGNYKTKVIVKGNHTKWFDIKVKVLEFEGIPISLVLMNDIDARVKTERRLRNSEAQFRDLFKSAPIGIALVKQNGQPVVTNDKLSEITGYSASELKNMTFAEFTHPDDVEKDLELFNELIREERNEYELLKRFICKDEKLVWGELKVTTINNADGETLVLGMVEDRTEEVAAKGELLETRDKANESSRLKSAFLASISHELRTPLNAVLGFSDIIQSISEDENIREYSNLIYENGFKLMTIIDDILELAMSDNGKVRFRPDEFEVEALALEFKHQIHEVVYNSGKDDVVDVQITCEGAANNNTIITDKSKIYQIMINLIKNAVKFTDQGYIKLGCFQPDAENISFYIQDSGIGISESQKEVIFDFFRQADGQDSSIYGGIGIGLAISKRIAKAMHGDITVESVAGKGSTFTLTIPIDISVIEESK